MSGSDARPKGAPLRDGHRMVADDVITRDCIASRGRYGAWDEIVHRLCAHYEILAEAWEDTDAEIALTLSLKRPETGGEGGQR